MRNRGLLLIALAIAHLTVTIVCLSQTAFNIIPHTADTHIAPTPLIDAPLVILLVPLLACFALLWFLVHYLMDVQLTTTLFMVYVYLLALGLLLNSWTYAYVLMRLTAALMKRDGRSQNKAVHATSDSAAESSSHDG